MLYNILAIILLYDSKILSWLVPVLLDFCPWLKTIKSKYKKWIIKVVLVKDM